MTSLPLSVPPVPGSLPRRTLLSALAASALLPLCAASQTNTAQSTGAPKLRLIGHTTLAHKLQFQGTTVGGLSGLDYDKERGVYYALSDDRSDYSPARFYTLKLPLTPQGMGSPELLRSTVLLAPNGKPYPNRRTASADSPDVPDPESIRLRSATNTLYWASEGDAKRSMPAFVREMRMDGSYSSQLPLPAMLAFSANGTTGLRDNKALEGLSFSPSGDTLWLATEAALLQDGPAPGVGVAGGPIRLTQFAVHSGQPFRQIAYLPDAVPAAPVVAGVRPPAAVTPSGLSDNGISEIWMASETGMLVLERAWSYGVGNSVRLYWLDTEDADDVMELPSLAGAAFKPAAKTLLLDFQSLGLPHLDNLEGMTRGPTLPNGNPTLVFVSDDNFNSSQVTQFIALEWLL